MQAIVRALQTEGTGAEVAAVITNKADAPGLAWARARDTPAHVVAHRDYDSRESFDLALAKVIEQYNPDYVLLAGFMRVLTVPFVERYHGKLINIHPSLLPAFPGLHTHQQALAAGVQWHGCTVHFVTPVLDHGPIVAQGILNVQAEDTPESLAIRLLDVEHYVYAKVAQWLAQGRVSLDAMQRVQVQGVVNRAFILTPQGVVAFEL
jgi:phosphoribosylglycinamide formyltransferase-1